jgi:hypothetical protein
VHLPCCSGESEEEGIIPIAASLANHPLAAELRRPHRAAFPRHPVHGMLRTREAEYGCVFRTNAERALLLAPPLLPFKGAGRLTGFRDSVFVGQYSADGERYIAASQDRTIRVFDTADWLRKGLWRAVQVSIFCEATITCERLLPMLSLCPQSVSGSLLQVATPDGEVGCPSENPVAACPHLHVLPYCLPPCALHYTTALCPLPCCRWDGLSLTLLSALTSGLLCTPRGATVYTSSTWARTLLSGTRSRWTSLMVCLHRLRYLFANPNMPLPVTDMGYAIAGSPSHWRHSAVPHYLPPGSGYGERCLFSVCFSPDSTEILGGSNDGVHATALRQEPALRWPSPVIAPRVG